MEKLVYAHLLDGSDRAACRGDCFSLADLSAAERLYQGGNGGSDIRSIFGVYHMNLTQAVYAGILGVVFAYFLEITGSLWASVLLHMGANIWSLLLPEMLLRMPEEQMIIAAMGIYIVLLCVLGTGSSYFKKRACRRRMV